MMRKSVLVLTVIAVLTAGALFASGSAPRSSAVTVGDFAVKVAKALGYKATDQKSAVSSLKAAGVSLEAADLSSSLTEGKAARILSDLGLKVNTADPASPLTTQKAMWLSRSASATSTSTRATLTTRQPGCGTTG